MIRFVTGDMFDTAADIRVNTVNCVGVMGAGVALAFKRRFPEMFTEYQEACRRGRRTPDCIQVYRSDEHEWIINAAAKNEWRKPAEYAWIESILAGLREFIFDDAVLAQVFGENGRKLRITIPALGCGHGGLAWGRVKVLIVRYLSDLDADIFVFAPLDPRFMGGKESGKHAVWVRGPRAYRVIRKGLLVSCGGRSEVRSHCRAACPGAETPRATVADEAPPGQAIMSRTWEKAVTSNADAQRLAFAARARVGIIAPRWYDRDAPPQPNHSSSG